MRVRAGPQAHRGRPIGHSIFGGLLLFIKIPDFYYISWVDKFDFFNVWWGQPFNNEGTGGNDAFW